MLIFAVFPLFALFAQPLGNISYWFPIIIIGIAGAAHQSWSANIYSVGSDMFPKSAVATIIGIGGMAGGVGAFLINMCSGILFDYAAETQMVFFGGILRFRRKGSRLLHHFLYLCRSLPHSMVCNESACA